MPFTTGTALSPSDLMKQINTFITANGWVKLRGETDIVPASPKSARYWRILIVEQQIDHLHFFQLQNVEFRETVGGSNIATTTNNWSASSDDGINVVGNLVPTDEPLDESYWQSQDVGNDGTAWVMYDFGAAQVIRQCVVKVKNDREAPSHFYIQWSHDKQVWTTMFAQLPAPEWDDDESRIYNFSDGFVYSDHASSTVKRSETRGQNKDWFVWQGPGYDADRRVYIGMRSDIDLPNNSHYLELRGFTDFGGTIFDLNQEEGTDAAERPHLLFTSGQVSYWLYVNSLRIILITKNDVSDYTSAYLGFGAAFAQPEDWAFPLIISGTINGSDTALASTLR